MTETDPIFEEIEELFDKFTESSMFKGNYAEDNELAASNLLIAYALLKNRKVNIFTRIQRWLRRIKNGRDETGKKKEGETGE